MKEVQKAADAPQQDDRSATALRWAHHALSLRDEGHNEAALALAHRALRLVEGMQTREAVLVGAAVGSVRLSNNHVPAACAMLADMYEAAHIQGMERAKLGEIAHQLALARFYQGQHDMARLLLQRACEAGCSAALWDQAVTDLLMGDWGRGFREYEYRLERYAHNDPREIPSWDGKATDVLWVISEQGRGDIFMLSRYLLWAAQRCRKLIFSTHADLAPLFAGFPGVGELRLMGGGMPDPEDATAYCWMASLPMHHGTDLKNVPPDPGWFKHIAKAPDVAANAPAGNMKVGLCWAGSPTHARDRDRSIPLEKLLPVLGYPKATIFSLQVGARQKDIAALGAQDLMVDASSQLGSWMHTAATLRAIDLVISCDTSVAHLAGAIGVPCWLLISKVPDWRWLLEGTKTKWYESVRLYRQEWHGDWSVPINRVCYDLEREIELRAS